jgi:hypothetical protein
MKATAAQGSVPLVSLRRRALGLPAAGLALLMCGCSGATERGYQPLEGAVASGGATQVTIRSPKEGAGVGPTFTVKVEVDGRLGAANSILVPAGLPHLHFRLDGGDFDPESAEIDPAVAKREYDDGYSASVKTELTYRDIPPGEHDLLVELVESDHDPAHEIASAAVTFDVEK